MGLDAPALEDQVGQERRDGSPAPGKITTAVLLLLLTAGFPGCGRDDTGANAGNHRPETPAGEETADFLPRLNDFSLTGYADEGKRKWEVTGRTAVLSAPETIEFDDVRARSEGEDNLVTVTAESGVFKRAEKILELAGGVIVSTDDGGRLTTETLTWAKEDGILSTPDRCFLEKGKLRIDAVGMKVRTEAETAEFGGEVTAELESGEVITCSGPLDVHYREDRAVFRDDVRMTDRDGNLSADRMEIDFDTETGRIVRLATSGNVRREHWLKDTGGSR